MLTSEKTQFRFQDIELCRMHRLIHYSRETQDGVLSVLATRYSAEICVLISSSWLHSRLHDVVLYNEMHLVVDGSEKAPNMEYSQSLEHLSHSNGRD